MKILWKPMLAAKPDPAELDAAIAALKFPVLASPKLDGIRATVQGGKLLSRSLKPIPNLEMQKLWGRKELEGLDGEIIAGSPFGEGVFNRTTRVVMKRTASVEGAAFYVFDSFDEKAPFSHRINTACDVTSQAGVSPIGHPIIKDLKALLAYEEKQLKKGYEGICVRDPNGLYKQGRSTLKEGGLVAIKRFVDAEAVVLDTYEQEENTNPKTMNELGKMRRSSHKAGKTGKDTLGGFTVRMLLETKGYKVCDCLFNKPCDRHPVFNIGTGVGLTDAYRKELWRQRKTLPGKIVKFRYQLIGTEAAPRQPIWLGWRDVIDM
jgi:DNA ligase-1